MDHDLIASLFNYNSSWNIILLVIGGCSILGFTIFIERLLHLRRSEVDTNKLIISLRQAIKDGNIVEAIRICEGTGGTVANIVKAGLNKHNRSKEDIESAMEVTGLIEIASLGKKFQNPFDPRTHCSFDRIIGNSVGFYPSLCRNVD